MANRKKESWIMLQSRATLVAVPKQENWGVKKKDMKRIALVTTLSFALALPVTLVHADEWKKIVELDDSFLYLWMPTPDFKGKPIKIWSLQDFKEPHATAGQKWQSRVELEEYDCANEQIRTDEVIFYPERLAKGYPVQSFHVEETEAVMPGTLGATLFKAACSD
jgi:hypothetical protein